MRILTQMSWVFFATGKGQRGEKGSARRAGGQQPCFEHSGLPMDASCRGGERLTFPEHLCPPPPSVPFSWEGQMESDGIVAERGTLQLDASATDYQGDPG